MLPQYFRERGYFAAGAGKVFHSLKNNDPKSWDSYEDGDGADPQEQAALKSRYGGGDGRPAWHVLDGDGSKTRDGVNAHTIDGFIADKTASNKPFFLAAAFHKPHLPWTAPKRFFDLYDEAKLAVPSEPPTNDVGDTYSSPRWNISSTLYWSKGPWTASSSFSYMSGFHSDRASISSNPISNLPAMRMIDLRGSYEFKEGVWRKYGKGLRLGVGVANVTDEKPPFTNNIYGFNGGVYGRWAFGRSLEFSFTQPF